MDWSFIPLWITSVSAAGGVIYSLARNGKNQRKQDIEIKVELQRDIEEIQKRLNDPHDGLGAIRREVGSMKENCARATSEFNQRIAGLESTDKKERNR